MESTPNVEIGKTQNTCDVIRDVFIVYNLFLPCELGFFIARNIKYEVLFFFFQNICENQDSLF